jgi:hypothetical protein
VTIDNLRTVDIVATKPGSSDVQLVVSDHWDWTDVQGHCYQLQEKLNGYLSFIETGELHARPEVQAIRNPEICFAVYCLHEPPAAAYEFFARARGFVEAEGYRFRLEVGPVRSPYA